MTWLLPSSRMPYVATLVLSIALLVTVAVTAPAIVTDSDIALTEIYTDLAADRELRVGPYSRFAWNHPGPIYFYLQAPLYVVSARNAAALFAGAVALNLSALAILGWVIRREQNALAAASVVGGCLILACRVPRFLASPWTAHVPVLPLLALLVVCAAVSAGRVALLPLATLLASFTVQTHVSYVPLSVTLLSVAIAANVWGGSSNRQELSRQIVFSACVFLVLWSLPLMEALEHDGGNLAALWTFFTSSMIATPGHSWSDALRHALYGLTGIARADLVLPWGGHFAVDVGPVTWCIAVAETALIAALAVSARRRKKAFQANLSLLSLLALLVGVWSLTHVPDDILDHEIFWLSALGALNCGLIAGAGIGGLTRQSSAPTRPIGTTAGLIVVVAAGLALGASSFRDFTAFERRRTDRAAIVRMYEAVQRYLNDRRARKPLVTLEPSKWSQAAGVILRLRRAGYTPAVPDGWIHMFTSAFARRGDEDTEIRIGGPSLRSQHTGPSDKVVLYDSLGLYVEGASLTRR
jgi:hypothetical protein